MNKRILSILLLISLLASASCGSGGAEGGVTTASGDTTTAAPVETGVTDNLGTYDFGGEEFHMLTRFTPLFYPNLDIEEQTGDALDDAVYNRNRRIEERFNFEFKETLYDYTIEKNDWPRQFLLAGDDTYDLYTGRMINLFTYAAEGMIMPVGELAAVDPDKPYWNAQLYSDLQVAGENMFAVGDFNLSALDFTHVMLFNKQMVDDYQLGDLYEIVRSGKWTYDKFEEVGKQVISDLNGDAKMDVNDQYGYTSLVKQVMPSFWIAARAELITKDGDGMLQYIAPKSEKVTEVFTKIFEMTWDTGIWHQNIENTGAGGTDAELEIFKNGKALFTGASCFQITAMMRDAEVEFGILPYPKWDENQDKYYSRIEGCELFGVSYANPNPEMAGVILEAMACESYNTVRPTYYDVTLKVKGTRDEDSAEMLDIIFENRVFDYADTVLCSELRDGVIHTAMKNNNRDMVSVLTGVESKAQAALDVYNEGFVENAK
ncbi:MAG: extracellular solute-binding protein [Ruminococcaceae bacterium]|nr:extracellular solute-binding protein [Oscillospiraceae bacterium]